MREHVKPGMLVVLHSEEDGFIYGLFEIATPVSLIEPLAFLPPDFVPPENMAEQLEPPTPLPFQIGVRQIIPLPPVSASWHSTPTPNSNSNRSSRCLRCQQVGTLL